MIWVCLGIYYTFIMFSMRDLFSFKKLSSIDLGYNLSLFAIQNIPLFI